MDVIIPTKNCAHVLEDCLKSLREQIEPVNIIVVDANSKDGTREIARKYRATLIDEPPSDVKGSRRAVACNEGLRNSNSELVAFLDSDTEVPPTWSRDMVAYFNRNADEKIAAITSGCTANEDTKLSKAISQIIKVSSTHAHRPQAS